MKTDQIGEPTAQALERLKRAALARCQRVVEAVNLLLHDLSQNGGASAIGGAALDAAPALPPAAPVAAAPAVKARKARKPAPMIQPPPKAEGIGRRAGSVSSRIAELIEALPVQFTTKELKAKLPKSIKSKIATDYLARMLKLGQLARRGHGAYERVPVGAGNGELALTAGRTMSAPAAASEPPAAATAGGSKLDGFVAAVVRGLGPSFELVEVMDAMEAQGVPRAEVRAAGVVAGSVRRLREEGFLTVQKRYGKDNLYHRTEKEIPDHEY